MNPIASSLPGRLRLRDRALRDRARLDALRARIVRWRGVLRVESNSQTGSLLIHYDATQLTPARCEARAVAAAEQILETRQKIGVGGTAPHDRHHGGALRVKANRWAKRAMLVSLAVSLSLVAAGAKRWHALTGVLFLHALAAHLWVHRRRLLK